MIVTTVILDIYCNYCCISHLFTDTVVYIHNKGGCQQLPFISRPDKYDSTRRRDKDAQGKLVFFFGQSGSSCPYKSFFCLSVVGLSYLASREVLRVAISFEAV